MQHDAEKDELLERSLAFINKLPDLKNFGVIPLHTIPKPKPKSKPVLKIILAIIAILVLIAKRHRLASIVRR